MALSGLPSLPKISSRAIKNTVLGSLQSSFWQLLSGSATWGVYESGSSTVLAFDADTVLTMTLNEESTVSDYRIQTGSFVTYSKVAMPMEVPVSFCKSGNDTELGAFIDKLKAAVQNTTKYDILMPEKSFTGMTMTRYSIERKRENSINMLFVDCWFKEVREAPEYYYSRLQDVANTSKSPIGDATPISDIKGIQAQVSTVKSNITSIPTKLKSATMDIQGTLMDKVSLGVGSVAVGAIDTWQTVSGAISSDVAYTYSGYVGGEYGIDTSHGSAAE